MFGQRLKHDSMKHSKGLLETLPEETKSSRCRMKSYSPRSSGLRSYIQRNTCWKSRGDAGSRARNLLSWSRSVSGYKTLVSDHQTMLDHVESSVISLLKMWVGVIKRKLAIFQEFGLQFVEEVLLPGIPAFVPLVPPQAI
jgi:hypothetical protein